MAIDVNTVAAAILTPVFLLLTVSIASEGIFHAENPEKPGYVIAAAEAGAEAGAAEPAAAATPIATLLAKADVASGETIFKKCQACHDGSKGGPNKVGPNLWGIVSRPMASHEGFSYSAAIKTFSKGSTVAWDYDALNHFLTAPKKYIDGTAMGFAGLKKEDERANVIAYLRTLADTPVALPAAQ